MVKKQGLITKEDILTELNKALESSQFLVEIKQKKPDSFVVYIDGFEGINISECRRINKSVCSAFDRDVYDFELEVSSPGLSKSFKVPQQYEKNIGKQVEVIMTDGEKLIGKLKHFDNKIIKLEIIEKKDNFREEVIELNSIKTCKSVIIF